MGLRIRTLLLIVAAAIFAVNISAQQKLQIGQQAPDFTAQTIDGKQVSLSQLKGKVVVLTFWSTKCQICHSEIPKLNAMVDHYKDKDVAFLALTMENEAKVQPYLQKNPFNYMILTNGFGVVLKYANMSKDGSIDLGFPSYFLIDRSGTIGMRAEGWDKIGGLDQKISQFLAE